MSTWPSASVTEARASSSPPQPTDPRGAHVAPPQLHARRHPIDERGVRVDPSGGTQSGGGIDGDGERLGQSARRGQQLAEVGQRNGAGDRLEVLLRRCDGSDELTLRASAQSWATRSALASM